MTVDWSSEVIKWQYRDLQATAMSVDYSGNNVLLAGRRWLAIKPLGQPLEEDTGEVIKKYPRHSKYDAADAEWCQTQQGQRLCAISSNQRVDVYHWRNGDLTCTNSLRGHTRVVSDTHFHRQDHNLIATCSIDTFTHIWDLRDARKPILSLCAVAGASQVQWNKVNNHIIATAHDGDIKIWDKRKGSSPIHYISAHLCKIHGVDWSPHHEYQLVTSSQDGSIKYFDINNARRPENTITTNFPVWRAIYTPFGSGLLTIGVGWGGLARGESAGVVGVWVDGTLTHRLVGHTDTIQTMRWRPGTPPHAPQLVTWARDQTLRVWAMHPTLLRMCHHYLPEETDADDDTSESMSYSSVTGSVTDLTVHEPNMQEIQMVKLSSQKPSRSLDEEFESVRDMANMVVTDMSMDARTCTVRAERNGYVANLQVNFPQLPTEVVIPRFAWLSGTTLDSATTVRTLRAINLTAHHRIRAGQPCLLHCLKTLGTLIDQIPVKSKEEAESLQSSRCASESESAGDACVPFPRTCGARWCAVSTLVLFNRPPNARRLSLKQDCGTPRSMSSLSTMPAGGVLGSVSPHAATTPSPTGVAAFPHFHRHLSNSITTFYFQDRWKAQGRRPLSRGRGSISGVSTPRVVLYSASHLLPLSRSLADKYVINNANPVEMCEHNAEVARGEGADGLARAWLLAALAARGLREQLAGGSGGGAAAAAAAAAVASPLDDSSEESAGWAVHPLCLTLVQSLISHYAKSSDIQTAAMLACTFAVFNDTGSSSAASTTSGSSYGNGTSPYSTLHQLSDLAAEGWARGGSASCSEADNACSEWTYERSLSCVLDERAAHLYQGLRRAYADVLHRWQLLNQRAEVMKQVIPKYEKSPPQHVGPELASECRRCRTLVRDAACSKCSRLALSCAVCSVGVRGLASACAACGHGGHAAHMARWFAAHDVCPTGCGCKCLADNASAAAWKCAKFV